MLIRSKRLTVTFLFDQYEPFVGSIRAEGPILIKIRENRNFLWYFLLVRSEGSTVTFAAKNRNMMTICRSIKPKCNARPCERVECTWLASTLLFFIKIPGMNFLLASRTNSYKNWNFLRHLLAYWPFSVLIRPEGPTMAFPAKNWNTFAAAVLSRKGWMHFAYASTLLFVVN